MSTFSAGFYYNFLTLLDLGIAKIRMVVQVLFFGPLLHRIHGLCVWGFESLTVAGKLQQTTANFIAFLTSAVCLVLAPALFKSQLSLSFLGVLFFSMIFHDHFSLSLSSSLGPLVYPLFLLYFLKFLSVFPLSPAVLHSCFSGDGGGQGRRKREEKKIGRGNLSFRGG